LPRLFSLIRGIVRLLILYFSTTPSIWVVLNPLLYIMFLPLGVHFIMTLPWPFLNNLLDPYGRGTTLYFLTYVYAPLINNKPVWDAIETALILFGASLSIWSFAFWVKSRGKLMKNGPYRVIRHPQYLGIILTVLGLSFRTARPIALISWGTMTYMYLLMALFEERSLSRKFGGEYESYRAKTWFMFPVPKVLTKGFNCFRTLAMASIATLAFVTYIMSIIYGSYYYVISLRGVTF